MAGSHDISSFHYNSETNTYVTRTTKRELGDNDVLVRTTHSGVCYTDVHAKGTGCSLGHEGVGIVKQLGSEVANLKEGDRVGWGWMHSVRRCDSTLTKLHLIDGPVLRRLPIL